jgi:putative SOS response-associated peptidase YedK
VTADLFGFLTTEPNAHVGAVPPQGHAGHPDCLDDWDTWLQTPWDKASILQRPLPDGALQLVAKGGR